MIKRKRRALYKNISQEDLQQHASIRTTKTKSLNSVSSRLEFPFWPSRWSIFLLSCRVVLVWRDSQPDKAKTFSVRKIQTLKRIWTLLFYLYGNNSKCEKQQKLLKDTSSYTAPLFSSPVWKALLLKRANSLHQVFFGQSSKRRLKDSLFRSRCCCKEGKKYVSILLKSSVNLSIT